MHFTKRRINIVLIHIKILGMIRIRNEELIIQDTLDHLSQHCDAIICFDDASVDKTIEIISNHEKVVGIIRNFVWESDSEDRLNSETNHRKLLVEFSKNFKPEWLFYADADERFVGDIRGFLLSDKALDIDILRISLFDAYLTPFDSSPFKKGEELLNFRKKFGPERRDIAMIWKSNNPYIKYIGKDSREPNFPENLHIVTKFLCQHYGKSLSIQHWEETCNYYINHFPYEPYGKKWFERKGKAIHLMSDFDNPLYYWDEELFENAIKIHPL
ncbi:glycosyltransferase family 2 protein [Paenibacillus nuruki]|nr:glycosyltransferase family 2 protein [Paenibacillus nuruki]